MSRWIVLALMQFWSTATFAANISATTGRLELWAGDLGHLFRATQIFRTPQSGFDSIVNSVNGATAQASYELSSSGFNISYSLSRPRHLDDLPLELATANGYVQFTVDEPVQYVVAGEISTIDPEGRNTTLWLQLFDNAVRVFNSAQLSHATPNPHFILGRQDGDLDNALMGALTGTFLPYHEYRFEYYSRIFDEPLNSLQPATATGYFSVSIVPEPSTAILIFLGLLGLGWGQPQHHG